MSEREKEFKQALRHCGITDKGEPLARVIWDAVEEIFARANNLGLVGNPMNLVPMIKMLAQAKAANIEAKERSRRMERRS